MRPPLLDGWDKPAATIVVSGEQHGYFEPCGCTGGQLGGMSRRGDLFKQLRDRGWAVTGLDVGGSVQRQRAQDLLKFKAITESMRLLGYTALAIGPEELNLGLDNLIGLNVSNEAEPKTSLSFLAANVVFYDTPDLGTPKPFRIVEVGDVKIGVTAILGADFNGTALMVQNNKDLKIKKPEEVLPGVIAEMKKQNPDFMVLLSHTSVDESRSLAKNYPDFNLVLTAGGPEDPDGVPEKIGDSLLLSAGRKGKSIGVVGFFPQKEKKDRFRFQLVEVDGDRLKDTKEIVEQMRQYQRALYDDKLAGNHSDNIPIEHASGAKFVGSAKCGECHTKAFEVWKGTPHAKAFESLKHARKGAPDFGITRIYDAECIACHVTGWDPQNVYRYSTGFINEEFAKDDPQKEMSKLLMGVGCENCHGPGSKHIELVEADKKDEARKLMKVTLEQAKKNVCYSCHDHDNSPHFDFEMYWEKIKHPGLD
nr:putative cytochrome c-554 [uncultured bacterium]